MMAPCVEISSARASGARGVTSCRRGSVFHALLCSLMFAIFPVLQAAVLINEIHYNADVKTEHVEFVELYNTGPASMDLSGWKIADGIEYRFPAGTIISSNGFIVVAENPAALAGKFGYNAALGPYTNSLSAYGEK